MTYAAIIPFFDYGQGNNHILWKFFQLHCKKWIHLFDKVYVVDSGCNLHELGVLPELQANPKLEIIKKPAQSHWQNMNELIREAKEESILLLDSDTIIYDWEKLHSLIKFYEAGEYQAMGMFDGSGGVDMSQYPIMRENEYRFERRRFCPYFFLLQKKALRPDFDFTPRGGENWTDSMGTVTEQMLEDKVRIFELPDDRSTISLEDTGDITHVQWLDTPPKKWAMKENPDKGWYHVRNFGGALKIIKDKEFGAVPGREARRLLAWAYAMADKAEIPVAIFQSVDVEVDVWNKYYEAFKEYHSFLNKI